MEIYTTNAARPHRMCEWGVFVKRWENIFPRISPSQCCNTHNARCILYREHSLCQCRLQWTASTSGPLDFLNSCTHHFVQNNIECWARLMHASSHPTKCTGPGEPDKTGWLHWIEGISEYNCTLHDRWSTKREANEKKKNKNLAKKGWWKCRFYLWNTLRVMFNGSGGGYPKLLIQSKWRIEVICVADIERPFLQEKKVSYKFAFKNDC